MSDHHVELIVAGVIASDSLHLHLRADASELIIGGVTATGILDLTQNTAAAHESTQSGQASASDLIQLSTSCSVQVTEQVKVSDSLQIGDASAMQYASETANASDSVQTTLGVNRQTGDTASASSPLQISVHHQIALLDTIQAADSAQARQHGRVELLAAVFASDNLKDSEGTVIWTARSDRLAMSALVPESELNALAVVGGTLAASGAKGLYRFTGKPLAPFIQSGWLHPEGSALWRAESAYFQHSGEPLTLHLTVSDGDEQTYSYTSEPRNAKAPVPSKVKLGRGIRARALRIGLSGEDFALDGGELILNPLSRKY